MTALVINKLHPKKLLHTKWTATQPVNKEKHFVVLKVIDPALTRGRVEQVEIEAVFTHRIQLIPWKDLLDAKIWKRGWV